MRMRVRRRPGYSIVADPVTAGGAAEFETLETAELARLLRAERIMIRIRWCGVAFALIQVLTYYRPYPPGLLQLALGLTALLAVGNIAIWRALPATTTLRRARWLSILALLLNGAVFVGLVFVYTFDVETAIWALLYVLPMEAAIRFQLRGALLAISALTVAYTIREAMGTLVYGNPFLIVSITFRMGIGFIIAGVAGFIAQSLTKDREQLAALSRITQTVASTPSLQVILAAATRELASLFRVRTATIALFDAEHRRLLLMAEHSPDSTMASREGVEIPLVAGGPAMQAIERRRALAVTDLASVPMLPQTQQMLAARGVRGFMLAPLLARDDVIGLILAESDRPRAFSPADLALAEAVAASSRAAAPLRVVRGRFGRHHLDPPLPAPG